MCMFFYIVYIYPCAVPSFYMLLRPTYLLTYFDIGRGPVLVLQRGSNCDVTLKILKILPAILSFLEEGVKNRAAILLAWTVSAFVSV